MYFFLEKVLFCFSTFKFHFISKHTLNHSKAFSTQKAFVLFHNKLTAGANSRETDLGNFKCVAMAMVCKNVYEFHLSSQASAEFTCGGSNHSAHNVHHSLCLEKLGNNCLCCSQQPGTTKYHFLFIFYVNIERYLFIICSKLVSLPKLLLHVKVDK